MQLVWDKRFQKKVKGIIGKFSFEVGVLQDAPHKEPMERPAGAENFSSNLSTYAGDKVRKKSRTNGPLSVAQVSEANRNRTGVNYLTAPFEKTTSDIVKFTQRFLQLAFGRGEKKRLENLLQAIVRNPILRGEYGKQARSTTREKGFYRPMIDTGQLFKAIKAVVKVGGSRV